MAIIDSDTSWLKKLERYFSWILAAAILPSPIRNITCRAEAAVDKNQPHKLPAV